MKKFFPVFLSISFFLSADQYDTIAPKPVPREPGQVYEIEDVEKNPDQNDKILVKSLNQLVFTDSPRKVGAKNYCDYDGIAFLDISVPKERAFIEEMDTFLDEPITINQLGRIKKAVVAYYRNRGYPLVGVSIPAGQNITDGTVYVLILIGKVGEITVEGEDRWFTNRNLPEKVSLNEGEIVRTGPLLRDLAWFNNNPFRQVDLIYEKGRNLSETNLVFRTRERFPLRLYGGYENTGNIVAGDSRWVGGINFGNLWGVNHQLNYQFMSASDFNKWWGNAANYIAPLPWRNTLKLFGSYVKTRPSSLENSSLPQASTVRGHQWQVGMRYFIPLPVFNNYRHDALFGYDFKRTNNFLDFGTLPLIPSTVDISQLVFGYEGNYEHARGSAVWGLNLYLSPGGMTAFNHTKDFQSQRIGSNATYIYGRATIDSIYRLGWNFSWELNSLFQWASTKLLPSEELSLGGYLSIRGYDENTIISDNGIIIKNEVRSPPLTIFRKIQDVLQFLIFLDFGWGNEVDRSIFDENNKVLASVGPGFRYRIQEYVNVRFDYGFQIDHISVTKRPFISSDHARLHFGAIVGF